MKLSGILMAIISDLLKFSDILAQFNAKNQPIVVKKQKTFFKLIQFLKTIPERLTQADSGIVEILFINFRYSFSYTFH